jgi:protein O-mannosyl-transferase
MGTQSKKVKRSQSKQGGAIKVWWFLIPALLGMGLYLNTLGHQWCLDDYSVIVDNWVTKQGWSGIATHLTHDYRYGYWSNSQGDLYRPLSLIMFSVEWALFGDNPMPGHVVNVLLYGAILFLFGYSIYKWCGRILISLLAAILFAVHPIHTEVVANIKSRDELLTMFFLLATWLSWFYFYRKPHQIKFLVLACITFFMALISKESALTFLPIIPLSLYVFGGQPSRADYYKTAYLLFPAGLFLMLRQWVLGSVKGLDKVSILDNVLSSASDGATLFASVIRHIGEYLKMLFVPWPMSSDKGWNQIPLTDFGDGLVWVSLLIILAGIAAIVYFWKRDKVIMLGLVWFAATFSLASNLLFLIGTSYGERLLFLPGAGFILVVAHLFAGKHDKEGVSLINWFKSIKGMVFLAIAILFSVLTIQRNPAWYDSYSLYATDIKNNPEGIKLRYHYALETGKQATNLPEREEKKTMLQTSLKDLEKVTAAHPNYWEAHSTAGLYAFRLGDRNRAMASYQKAVALNPGAAIAWSNMGIIYAERGELDKAFEVYSRAVKEDPKFVDAWLNLGAIHAQQGRFAEALGPFQEALKYDPNNQRILTMIAACYRDMGQPEQAKAYESRIRK